MKTTITAIVSGLLGILVSCQQSVQKQTNKASQVEDTLTAKKAKPTEVGYAPVNGLKMYYEVYGEGKPIVLLHGSFMTIPLNWANIIPLFAGRKVIVAEMQGHGRTRDIDREISYEGMADDVSGLLKHLKIDSADVLGYSMGGGLLFSLPCAILSSCVG
ncbi:alpha/beta hydrolase [Sphingobacterium sp. N143]|uniref:alpha/beta fold hydrolase n=1 Tax=Sphingobacterium sp. N143 TaxID=2746727 RepID=UPI0025764AB8|nr:alpha/beta hydrolase [Sphingobacterium sp. N143]